MYSAHGMSVEPFEQVHKTTLTRTMTQTYAYDGNTEKAFYLCDITTDVWVKQRTESTSLMKI